MGSIFIYHNYLYYVFCYFTIYSFLGWCAEAIYASKLEGEFVNRGFLFGPFCPIYGIGTIVLMTVLEPLRSNIVILLVGSFFFPSFIEYITGFFLEKIFKTTWWDYTNNKFNIKGRVCLKFSLLWWAFSLFFLLVFHPDITVPLVNLLPAKYVFILANLLLAYFIVDFSITLISLLKLKELFSELNTVSAELKIRLDAFTKIKESISNLELPASAKNLSHKVTEKLEDTVENLSHKFGQKLGTLGHKFDNNEYKADIERFHKLETKIEELKGTYDNLLNNIVKRYARTFKAYPNLKTKLGSGILTDIKNKIKSLNRFR